jgi:MerR family transcriptional regulator, light-induced transcriptional regulator
MSMFNQAPLFNLSAVLQETGLKADVLRAWERRYDLPRPQRSPGGHRLYSQRDIETVKWLRARQSEGLSISRSVKLWNDLLHDGRNPLTDYLPPITDLITPTAGQVIGTLRSQWLEACMGFNGSAAEEVLNQAFALYPVETVCSEVLQKGLAEVGRAWYGGVGSVQQEHFTTTLAVRRLDSLILAAPNPTRSPAVLLGCPAGEWHTFPVLLINLLLRRRGLKTVYLGADVPPYQLMETAEVVHPQLIILAAQQLPSAASLAESMEVLCKMETPLAYGGLIFNRLPKLRHRIPGWFLGETIEQSIQQVERLLAAPEIAHEVAPLSREKSDLASLFLGKRPLVELDLQERLQKAGLVIDRLAETNLQFGDKLAAALAMGGPDLLEPDLDWLSQLLSGRHLPAEQFIAYLHQYSQALLSVLGAQAAVISDWLDAYTAAGKETA